MTRRVVKPQPESWAEAVEIAPYKGYGGPAGLIQRTLDDTRQHGLTEHTYGQPGDRLWVRETFQPSPDGVVYRASESDAGTSQPDDSPCWKPSIFMPRKLSRITLQIVSARVERLQELSETDAIYEGVQPCGHDSYHTDQHTCSFHSLWDSLNAKRGYGWDKNPWVWVIQFKRL
jgi:hypothetical protein